MNATQRRAAILECLYHTDLPVSATVLASQFSVSRQIIVGDIALLRASGTDICATPRGYMIWHGTTQLVRQIACRHDIAQMAAELDTIVDAGATVLDVIVEHPIYGQLTGPLHLSNREDVAQFLCRCSKADAQPLSRLTEGIHLHTIACPSEAVFQKICQKLTDLHILLAD